MLLYVPSVDEKSTISTVRSGWIAHDTVMSAKRGFAKIFQTAITMMEATDATAAIKHMLIHASDDAITSAKTFGAPKRKGGKVTVVRALPVAEEDRVYAGALAASSLLSRRTAFQSAQKRAVGSISSHSGWRFRHCVHRADVCAVTWHAHHPSHQAECASILATCKMIF